MAVEGQLPRNTFSWQRVFEGWLPGNIFSWQKAAVEGWPPQKTFSWQKADESRPPGNTFSWQKAAGSRLPRNTFSSQRAVEGLEYVCLVDWKFTFQLSGILSGQLSVDWTAFKNPYNAWCFSNHLHTSISIILMFVHCSSFPWITNPLPAIYI